MSEEVQISKERAKRVKTLKKMIVWAPFVLVAIAYGVCTVLFVRTADLNRELTGRLTPSPVASPSMHDKENLLWVGAQLTKQKGRIINYDVTGELGLVGEAAGEIKVDGRITTRIPLFGDTVNVAAFGKFTNLSAPYYMRHLVSNHFIWDNDFSKTRTYRAGGEIAIPWTRTRLSAGVENVENALYFDANSMARQHGGNV